MRLILALTTLLTGLVFSVGSGSAGPVDTSFGIDGVASTAAVGGSFPASITGDTAGRLVTPMNDGGYASRCPTEGITPCDVHTNRYLPNGTPDAEFGNEGTVTTKVGIGGSNSVPEAAVVTRGSGVVVAGWTADISESNPFLISYREDGSVNSSFGNNGIVKSPPTEAGFRIHAVARSRDGRLYAAGSRNEISSSGTPKAAVIRRYLPDGRIDRSFGAHGDVTFAASRRDSYTGFEGIEMNGAGTVVALGYRNGRLFSVRVRSSGKLDKSYADRGVYTQRRNWNRGCVPPRCRPEADLAITPRGGAVLQGQALGGKILLVKLAPRGKRDRTFSGDGIANQIVGSRPYPQGVALTGRGSIVIPMYTFRSKRDTNGTYTILQLDSHGRREAGFGNEGVMQLQGKDGGAATAAGTLRNGSVVVGGGSFIDSDYFVDLVKIRP